MFHWDSRSCSLLCNIFFPLGWGEKVLYDLKLKEGSPWQANRKPQSFRSKPTRTVLNLLQARCFWLPLPRVSHVPRVTWCEAELKHPNAGVERKDHEKWVVQLAELVPTLNNCKILDLLDLNVFECIWIMLNEVSFGSVKSVWMFWRPSETPLRVFGLQVVMSIPWGQQVLRAWSKRKDETRRGRPLQTMTWLWHQTKHETNWRDWKRSNGPTRTFVVFGCWGSHVLWPPVHYVHDQGFGASIFQCKQRLREGHLVLWMVRCGALAA